MILTPELIAAYKQILTSPEKYNFDWKPLGELFIKSKTVTASDELYNQFKQYIGVERHVPKVIFYIIMIDIFGNCNSKDQKGKLGYYLELNK